MRTKKILFLSLIFGAIFFSTSVIDSKAADCTLAGLCQGKNQNDDCTTNDNKPGKCGTFSPPEGSCICWPKAATTTPTAYDECIAQGGDYNDCKDRAGAPPASTTTTTPPPGNCTGTCRAACLTGENPLTGPYPDCVASSKPECCVAGTTPPASGTCPTGFKKEAGVCFPTGTGLSEASVTNILRNLLMWILGIFGFLAIMAFIISGIQYLISAGDEKALETAKRNMKWAIVGVVVALSGFVIILAVTAALQATTITF